MVDEKSPALPYSSLRRIMDTKDISALAKTHAEAILSSPLTKAELVMLLACIEARVGMGIAGIAPAAAPVPAAPKAPGQKIAEKGYPCVCVMCAEHVYTLNRDLYDNTSIKEFIEAYTPMPGFSPLNRQTKISNIENNISTNCPNCNGELCLYLAGKKI